MNESDWWTLLGDHKEELRNLVIDYHPAGFVRRQSETITAPDAEETRRRMCEEIRQVVQTDPLLDFTAALESRDGPKMLLILNEVWMGVPENRDWPVGFDVLCDLCSDGDVVYGDEINDGN